MTLITLLIVLLIERFALKSSHWQPKHYMKSYFNWVSEKEVLSQFSDVKLFATLASPAFGISALVYFLSSNLIEFIVSLLVLSICIGDVKSRNLYRQYLNAVSRKDEEAQMLLQGQLQGQMEITDSDKEEQHQEQVASAQTEYLKQESLGETLIWINFKFYAAPIFYFVFLGLPGLIFYTTTLYLVESDKFGQLPESAKKWLEVLFWIPARLVSLGYMIVGHFTNGLETWLKYAVNISKSSREMLCKVALASEHKAEQNKTQNAQVMVSLTKRNMVVFLVVVALLTLYGQIV